MLNYRGTNYRILRETPNALSLSCNGTQEIWVTKEWIRRQGMNCRIGKNPASLWF